MLHQKSIFKIFSYLFIIAIIIFLVFYLKNNWSKITFPELKFDYLYLIISFILFALSLIGLALLWGLILKKLEPANTLTKQKIITIYLASELAKYTPGNIWAIVGRVLWGNQAGASKKNLLISSFLDSVLAALSVIELGVILLFIALGKNWPNLYPLALVVIIISLIIIHPKIFYPLFNWFFKKIKKEQILPENFINYLDIIKINLFYFIVAIFFSLSFLFFVRSFTAFPTPVSLGLMSAFALSAGLGTIALFAPSGLGVREGILVLILKNFLPAALSVFLSLIFRIWLTVIEILLFSIFWLYNFFTSQKK
ncbi:MAG TPA: lysylphosphatidylglycerol synthase domain-containing protein [bacterium]|nr:lysylphosphatidylglycerol synthase domain-containing protein [bacterium]